jgi:hypothetical protein
MENQGHFESDLLKSLSGKKINELSSQEKELILKHCTEEEFKALQERTVQINYLFNSERANIQPGKKVKENLLTHFRQKKGANVSGSSLIELILNYRIPAYQPALAFMLVLAFYLLHTKPVPPVDQTYLALDTATKISTKAESGLAAKQIFSDSLPPETMESEISAPEKHRDFKKRTPMHVTPLAPSSVPDVFEFKDGQVNGRTLRDDTLLSVFFISPN